MQKLLFALLLICGLSPTASGQGFYAIDSVRTIQIIFTQSNWDHILDSLYDAGEDRLLGTCIIDGVQYDSVGVRFKGFSTYNANRTKNPFNIKLDYIRDNQTHEGYGTLKLANVWSDPSFLREVISYEVARKYMPAGLANYANVYVNGTLIGLYVNVQDVDKKFTRSFSLGDEGARIKGETEGAPSVYVVWGYKGQDSTAYMNQYTLDSDLGWSDLIDFTDTLNNYTSAVSKVLDIDRNLWMIAFDNLLVNLDAPINFAHNFYLYRDDSYRFNPIIWDLNMSFGGFSQIIGGSGLSITQMQQLNPYLNESNSNYPNINKFLSNASYKKQYVAHMKTMLTENFSNGWYQTRGQAIQNMIATHVQADPNKFSTYQNFLNNLTSAVGQTPGIVQLMAARVTYLNNLAAFTAQQPTVTGITHTPAAVLANTTSWVTAAVSNATTVQLAYRETAPYPFTKVTMLDDGSHHDGTAGDGVFGASITPGVRDVHYYVYAENASAGVFVPARAEFEDSTIAVTAPTVSSVVINEFMADNATTMADQDGEFEDWIEIYNPTASSISLNGCHLSDKFSNLGKWTFPDTSIAPYGYITVWADEDVSQVGLHANFALSKSGEAVIMTNADLVFIDSLTFGAQATDISLGRCPNGSGAFLALTPSFAAANACGSSYVCGDANADSTVDISDAVYLISYIFAGGPAPDPQESGDVNCDSTVDISDAVYLISYIFTGGSAPCAECK
jgi:hypothetical protein